MADLNLFRIGSRKSQLALTQTHLIIKLLKRRHPDKRFEVVTMDTIGDKDLDKTLAKIGDKNLFTKELEEALFNEEVDFIVHSLKDMPSALNDNFILACICDREHLNDVVIFRKPAAEGDIPASSLATLPEGSLVGTSSVRRVAQLKRRYPHLKFASVRGNLNTRLRKLDAEDSVYAAIILAKAGVIRLGWSDRIGEELTEDGYAVGQGALACECRAKDSRTRSVLCSIHDEASALTSICERSLMRTLEGGCSTPVAVTSGLKGDVLTLRGRVLSADGSQLVDCSLKTALPRTAEPAVSPQTPTDGSASDDNEEGLSECPKRRKVERRIEAKAPAFNPSEHLILGLSVYPICGPAVARMRAAQELGQALATRLLAEGAQEILEELRRNAPAQGILDAPTARPVDTVLNANA